MRDLYIIIIVKENGRIRDVLNLCNGPIIIAQEWNKLCHNYNHPIDVRWSMMKKLNECDKCIIEKEEILRI